MVRCTGCGKALDKMPDWLNSVQVEFVCNNCPKRQVKTIAQWSAEQAATAEAKAAQSEDDLDGLDDEDEEAED